eukprot:3328807-Pleurochrysis_carterae.AAC.3
MHRPRLLANCGWEGVGRFPRFDQMHLVPAVCAKRLVGSVRDSVQPLHAVPQRRGLRKPTQVKLAVGADHFETTDGRLAIVIEQGPHHGTHGVIDTIRGVGRCVGLGAARVERLLDACGVWVVVRRLASLVLTAHRVARAALRHEDGFVRQLRVALVELLPVLMAETLDIDRIT